MKCHLSGCLKGLCVLVTAGLILGAFPAAAQQPAAGTLPSPQSLIERHLEAIGGKAALAKITTRISTGTLLIKPMGIKGTVVSYQARPGKIHTRLKLDGVGEIERGCDGEVFWEKTARSGVRVMQGEERALMLVLTRMDLSDYAVLFDKMQTTGTTRVGDEECFEAALTLKGVKHPIQLDFSKASGRIVRMVTTLPSKDGGITVENMIGDYAKADAVLVARQAVEKALDVETRVTLTAIRQNVKIDGKIFKLPEAALGNPAGGNQKNDK